MYEQKRFADAATYMEQMLYAFQKTGKVLSALKEARETFEPGHMRDIMDESIEMCIRDSPQNVHIDLNIPVLLLRCGNIQDKHALEQYFQKL